MASNIEKLKSLMEKMLALLDDPHPGLSSWVGLYKTNANEITDFLIGDALPEEWKKTSHPG